MCPQEDIATAPATFPATSPATSQASEPFEPFSLEWQENGELAATEMFELVKRLRDVESGKDANELWRLSQKA